MHKDWSNNLSLGALENIQCAINDGSVEASIYVMENKEKIDSFIERLGEISRNEVLSMETQFFSLGKRECK